jgi:hypothetical protein
MSALLHSWKHSLFTTAKKSSQCVPSVMNGERKCGGETTGYHSTMKRMRSCHFCNIFVFLYVDFTYQFLLPIWEPCQYIGLGHIRQTDRQTMGPPRTMQKRVNSEIKYKEKLTTLQHKIPLKDTYFILLKVTSLQDKLHCYELLAKAHCCIDKCAI